MMFSKDDAAGSLLYSHSALLFMKCNPLRVELSDSSVQRFDWLVHQPTVPTGKQHRRLETH